MSGYKEQNFAGRLGTLGDIAEAAFEQMMLEDQNSYEVFGWRRPSTGMSNMSVMLRHKPDFYTGKGWLVEVMGLGRDGLLKGLKVDKWAAMRGWDEVQRLCFWIWNSSMERGVWVTMKRMAELVARSEREFGVKAFEVDGNKYYQIPWEWLTEGGE